MTWERSGGSLWPDGKNEATLSDFLSSGQLYYNRNKERGESSFRAFVFPPTRMALSIHEKDKTSCFLSWLFRASNCLRLTELGLS